MGAIAGRRRRFGARAIDLGVVFFAYIGTYWVAALGYYAVSGCTDTGLTTVCGDEDAGSYVVIGVFIVGFVFPLLYESALRRTLGKTVMGLEIAGPDGEPATRGLRLKRSFVTWAPLLALAAGTLSAPADVSQALGMVLFLYVVGLATLVIWHYPLPWDWLLGTFVIDRRAPETPETPIQQPASEQQAPRRRRYTKLGRRR